MGFLPPVSQNSGSQKADTDPLDAFLFITQHAGINPAQQKTLVLSNTSQIKSMYYNTV